eukprot:Pgem_evm1s16113
MLTTTSNNKAEATTLVDEEDCFVIYKPNFLSKNEADNFKTKILDDLPFARISDDYGLQA